MCMASICTTERCDNHKNEGSYDPVKKYMYLHLIAVIASYQNYPNIVATHFQLQRRLSP